VQGDGGPDPADAVLGHAVALEEAAGLVSAIHLESPAAAAKLLVQAQVVEHRPDVHQFRVEAETAVAALQAAEPVNPP
jgi:precorrin-6B methylase 2